MRTQSRTVEQNLARLARRAHGNVTREQLLDLGVSRSAIRRRVDKGLLLPEFPGVYRVGHRAPSVEARYMAAVLACGEGALLFDEAAAHLFRLIRGAAPPPQVLTRTERDIKGITTRRCRAKAPPRGTRYRGIPVTTVPQTLVDLAAHLSFDDLARAAHEAGVLYGTRPRQVEKALAARPKAKGATNLRAILRGDAKVTLSKLEQAFIALLHNAGLPLPITNRPASAHRVDCRWPEHRLTVELDSYRFHNSRHAWEEDRRREREAIARGDDFRRFTHGDVLDTPAKTLDELRGRLAPVSHSDLLRQNYARIGAPGGVQEIVATLDPEHELREFAVGDQPARTHKGHKGFYAWARQGMTTFSDTTMEATSFEEHGDTVLVTLEIKATAGGEPLDMLVHHVVVMRDGLILTTSSYLDAAQARAAAGFPKTA